MGRRRRIRTPDARRIGAAVGGPGIDPRTWVTAARIDEDPDAVHFDTGVGWMVDATPYGSGLEDEDGRPCRVLSTGAPGAHQGEYIPPSPGAEVLVAVPAGDPEAGCVVLGYLTNEDDAHPPETVTGLPIVPDLAQSTDAAVSPYDTEIVVSPHHRREEYGGEHTTQAPKQTLIAAEILLGGPDVSEPALLGQVTVDNTNELLQALSTLAEGLIPLVGPLLPLSALGTALKQALEALGPKIAGQRSGTVKLE